IWGMVGKPVIARGTIKHQRLFLNGRVIVDRSINHAIKEAFRGLIDPARHPTIILFLSMPPEQVDVNVHPAKAEVRFRNQSSVHGAVLSAVRSCLRQADLMPAVQLDSTQPWSESLQSARPLPELLAGAGPAAEFGAGLQSPINADARVAQASSFVEYFRR